MRLLVIISCYLVAVNAWPTGYKMGNMMGNTMGNMMGNNMGNMMGNNMGNTMGSNMMQNPWGQSMFGTNMNNMPGQQSFGHNQGQMWGMSGNNYNGAQQTWGQRQPSTQAGGQQQGQTMNNNILHLLLGSMLANNMRSGQQYWQPQYQQPWQPQQQQQEQQWGQWQQEKNMKDMEEIEEMMKKKMMKEMAELVMYQMELKEMEDAYMDAAKFLCLMVNASLTDAKKNNESVNNLISDEQMEKYENELKDMNDIEKFAWLLRRKEESDAIYNELFFRTSVWSCHSAYEYKKAVAKMEKMENDESTTGRMGGM